MRRSAGAFTFAATNLLFAQSSYAAADEILSLFAAGLDATVLTPWSWLTRL
jgi:hypothetical protein